MSFALSQEQELLIQKAHEGVNILVDACIGSGKTTSIQHLCQRLPSSKSILYLTYNRLLKVDAKAKIKSKNITVTNYHGFAFNALKKAGISCGITDLIQTFIREKPAFPIYDVLVIDEYQDIDQELSELLEIIKSSNPSMQIIAVGDMEQKIYDKTTLDVREFIGQFLGEYECLAFTKCFRLNADHAAMLGRIWGKEITGVNDGCQISKMSIAQVIPFLANQSPEELLCLGARKGGMSNVLNELEKRYPEKYNKKTVYASISDNDRTQAVEPKSNSAIFTTYDSSKGLEREICVVFDFVESYWLLRAEKPQQSYEILRNIFCVAASRGKSQIIFVIDEEPLLSEQMLSTPTEPVMRLKPVAFSEMFDFKYKESVEKCYALLDIKKVPLDDTQIIEVKTHDYLIDLSPCIGIYQEASFFEKYDIDSAIALYFKLHNDNNLYTDKIQKLSVAQKVLFLTALETRQMRYASQVALPFITKEEELLLHKRLSSILSKDDNAQVLCTYTFDGIPELAFEACGFADVVKDDVVYELKFVSELKHEYFLQCACYMIALNLKKGILWNTRKNELYEISIPNEKQFCFEVSKTVLKISDKNAEYSKYLEPATEQISFIDAFSANNATEVRNNCFAVIDIETTWSDRVMSIGLCVVEKESYRHLEERYYIIVPEAYETGMFSNALIVENCPKPCVCSRFDALEKIKQLIEAYSVSEVFAYNASFDRSHLPEMDYVAWYDIMRIAAYRQFNSHLPDSCEFYTTGKMKNNYGAEQMFRLLSGNRDYCETHNAALDAFSEAELMKMLNVPYEVYLKYAFVKTAAQKDDHFRRTSFSDYAPVYSERVKSQLAIYQDNSTEHSKESHTETVAKPRRTDTKDPFLELSKIDTKNVFPELSKINYKDVVPEPGKTGNKDIVPESNKTAAKDIVSEPCRIGYKDNDLEQKKERSCSNAQSNTEPQKGYERRTIVSAEAAALLGVSKTTVYKLIKEGSISATKEGNKYSISEESVLTFIEEQKEKKEREKKQRAQSAATFAIIGLMLLLFYILFLIIMCR